MGVTKGDTRSLDYSSPQIAAGKCRSRRSGVSSALRFMRRSEQKQVPASPLIFSVSLVQARARLSRTLS